MKKVNMFCLILMIASGFCYSQDSVNLYFKNMKILLVPDENKISVSGDSSKYWELILNVGERKFLYLKYSRDTLPVEMGQLGLYTINKELYLLREGIWLLDGNREKVQFKHSAKTGDPEEFPVSVGPIWYDSDHKVKKNRKKIHRHQ